MTFWMSCVIVVVYALLVLAVLATLHHLSLERDRQDRQALDRVRGRRRAE